MAGQRGAATGALINQRLGAVLIILMQPAHYTLRTPACTLSHCSGATALGDVMQGKEALARARMSSTQGQLAQIGHGLIPAVMGNTKHRS